MTPVARTRLVRMVVCGVAGAAFLVAGFLLTSHAARTGGPLAQTRAYQDGIPVEQGGVVTWGVVLPRNPTAAEIVVLDIVPVHPVGVTVVGVLVHRANTDGAVGQHYGYPPSGVAAFAASGVALAPAGAPRVDFEALIGVELTDGSNGSIDGLLIRYRHDDIEYADTLPYSLRVFPPGS